MLKYPLSQNEDVSAEVVGDFVKRFLAGDIKPSVKSEPIPATNDEGVYVLVADSFEEAVKDNSKDMLIECEQNIWCLGRRLILGQSTLLGVVTARSWHLLGIPLVKDTLASRFVVVRICAVEVLIYGR